MKCIGFVEYYHRDSCTSARVPGTTARLLFAGSWRLHRRGNKACFYGYNPYSPPHNVLHHIYTSIYVYVCAVSLKEIQSPVYSISSSFPSSLLHLLYMCRINASKSFLSICLVIFYCFS